VRGGARPSDNCEASRNSMAQLRTLYSWAFRGASSVRHHGPPRNLPPSGRESTSSGVGKLPPNPYLKPDSVTTALSADTALLTARPKNHADHVCACLHVAWHLSTPFRTNPDAGDCGIPHIACRSPPVPSTTMPRSGPSSPLRSPC